jgi:hypothetical protein
MVKVLINILIFLLLTSSIDEIKLKEVLKIGGKGIAFLQIREVKSFKDETILVSDKLSYELLLFDRNGNLIKKVGRKGKNDLEFIAPDAISISNNEHLAISDFSSSRIQILNKNLQHIKTFYIQGSIFDLEYDNDNNLWIAYVKGDGNITLTKFSESGKNLFTIYPRNSTKDEFIFQGTFHFDIYKEKIIIAHDLQNKVEIWDTQGNFIKDFNVKGLPQLSKKKLFSIDLFTKKYVPEGKIFWGVSTDESGRLFLLGATYSQNPYQDIYIYDLKGNYISQIKLPYRADYIEINKNNSILVVENDRTFIKEYKLIK